ncbi:MAG TPA: FliH/SctL family protein [Ignavibacteriaceae bacterium]|nr:FliH/SctL family protein [Ignavibacteriaceae bacterium]
MSDVIKINRRPINISSYSEAATVFQTSEEQEKENIQVALHNQFTKGFSEGQEALKEKLEREFNERLLKKYAELNNLISDLNDKSVQLNLQFEQLVMEVGFVIAGAILKREIERESIFKDMLDESLKKVLGANEIIVRLHPKDYESIVVEGKSFQMKDSFSKIKFEKDDRIELGGCFIESEIGNADGRISAQLTELKRKLDAGFNNQ